MTFQEKVNALNAATAKMESSKAVCIENAKALRSSDPEAANQWLERAAQHTWGFGRPTGWGGTSEKANDARNMLKNMKVGGARTYGDVAVWRTHPNVWQVKGKELTIEHAVSILTKG